MKFKKGIPGEEGSFVLERDFNKFYKIPDHWRAIGTDVLMPDGRIQSYVDFYNNKKLIAIIVGYKDDYYRTPILKIKQK